MQPGSKGKVTASISVRRAAPWVKRLAMKFSPSTPKGRNTAPEPCVKANTAFPRLNSAWRGARFPAFPRRGKEAPMTREAPLPC